MALVTLGVDIGLINFSYCVLRCAQNNEEEEEVGEDQMEDEKDEEKKWSVREWKLVNLLDLAGFEPGFSCNKVTPVDLHNIADFVLPALFSLEFLQNHQVQHVAIEQQPHGKYANTRMIALSHLVFSFFRRILIGGGEQSPLITVAMVSAGCKYQKVFLEKYGLTKQTKYSARKSLGVDMAERLCGEMDISAEAMSIATKNDDLADSFLLAYSEQLKWV